MLPSYFKQGRETRKRTKIFTALIYESITIQLYSPIKQEGLKVIRIYANPVLSPKSWDFDILLGLEYIMTISNNRYMKIISLNIKIIWLLSTVGLLRPFYAHRMDLNQCTISISRVLRHIVLALGERTGNKITKAISTHIHETPLIYPTKAFQAYRNIVAYEESIVLRSVFLDRHINALIRKINRYSEAMR
ncbi:hypothetical protein BY458DRAFT_487317 [Sporodiniella umbellata]|nr:hypothetical protein BY458DRAFT_487317 [Sporodiniella umbellata]